jgi:hypothetical protein
MTIWRMRFVFWVPKATNKHSEYVILLLFHCKNCRKNAHQFDVKCALPVMF